MSRELNPLIKKYLQPKIARATLGRAMSKAGRADQVAGGRELASLCSAEGYRNFTAHLQELAAKDGTLEVSALSDLQKEYRAWFKKLLGQFDATSPSDLTDDQKIKFFGLITKHWSNGEGAKKDAADIEVSQ